MVWLAPGEEFFPSSAPSFLNHVQPWTPENPVIIPAKIPTGPSSESWFLITKNSIDNLLRNKSSMIYGDHTEKKNINVPVYAQVTTCHKSLHFHVTYWLFFPYSQGKEICTVDLGPLGLWPIPTINGRCLGTLQEFGSHVGDWEHMSLYFKEDEKPTLMYISAHDAGALYKFESKSKQFLFQKQEVRVGVLQQPSFPKVVQLFLGTHPILFAAKGSHGLWAAPVQNW
ncbi:uncharacterized protein LOC142324727 isoform X2 [Lycorma delicatula]|uniref:uncharacterized protein LOC142324727 isoform X2 n=1 Tax=Lycorma delicatula TaxID=130591 RepID=UPI003F511EA3